MHTIVNTATGMKYPFGHGSVEERTLFRVTPFETGAKMYFDSKEQYFAWRQAKIEDNKTLRDMCLHVIPGLSSKA